MGRAVLTMMRFDQHDCRCFRTIGNVSRPARPARPATGKVLIRIHLYRQTTTSWLAGPQAFQLHHDDIMLHPFLLVLHFPTHQPTS